MTTTKPKRGGAIASILTTSQAAALYKEGVSVRRFQALLQSGRVIGAEQLPNGNWIIPKNFTVKPGSRGPK